VVDDLKKLLALEEIRALKARYFRCIDYKDWDELGSLFVADAVVDISDDKPGCIITGRDAFIERVSQSLRDCVSVHHGHCPEITFTSDTAAEGIWAMEDILQWSEEADSPVRSLRGYGHYFETYDCIDGRWHFRSLRLKRLRTDIEQC